MCPGQHRVSVLDHARLSYTCSNSSFSLTRIQNYSDKGYLQVRRGLHPLFPIVSSHLGTAIPKQLNGVATILQRMDWQSGRCGFELRTAKQFTNFRMPKPATSTGEGEENEGMVGDFVNFGHIGKEHVVNFKKGEGDEADTQQDDVFILICPQNMQGIESSIIPYLLEMTEAVGDRPIILINPDLVDKASSQGQQSVRGRQERIDFANSFKTIFQFQNIYYSGTSYFPILGASTLFGPEEMWVSHQRRDLKGGKGEVYVPVYASESMPDSEVLMSTFSQ